MADAAVRRVRSAGHEAGALEIVHEIGHGRPVDPQESGQGQLGRGRPRVDGHQHLVSACAAGHLGHRPRGLAGIHLNLQEVADATPHEQRMLDDAAYYSQNLAANLSMQATRPQTIGYSLADSPVGLAAWMYAMFQDVSDSNGDAESVFTLDEMLDDPLLAHQHRRPVTVSRKVDSAAGEVCPFVLSVPDAALSDLADRLRRARLLGYDRYYAASGDRGGRLTAALARRHPDRVAGCPASPVRRPARRAGPAHDRGATVGGRHAGVPPGSAAATRRRRTTDPRAARSSRSSTSEAENRRSDRCRERAVACPAPASSRSAMNGAGLLRAARELSSQDGSSSDRSGAGMPTSTDSAVLGRRNAL